ncbi:TRAM domain-containing protein [Halopiger xanaduensis]|uniref:Deoxyribonuclease/rho motif-related TRAM n=1 Tax=Halopiger xanaduensis (strain DSM 18323 / JCM 14033 / SH-6) TaxID=797210 RepID=F8D584_HALXS|nr:TRAM domain-containing protein [Halopiger xanaduensis]AEH36441.1 deoxyribonuclease/rho motif-related TRAM [Halopiger xanaduensis SH-6]
MADCPLADDCPSFSEPISGMGCQHYGDRGGKEWCQHYSQPIEDLKTQPVKSGEEVELDIVDMHESGAGVGRTEDGFIVLVDGLLPECRARVEITQVHSNHARAETLEQLPMDGDEEGDDADSDADGDADADEAAADDESEETDRKSRARERLGSRENFWGS